MGENSKIAWTEATWNPVTGCTKVSEGCAHCYAEKMSLRLKSMGQPNYANGFDVTLHPEALSIPLHWKKPRRIFICSMGDIFHEAVSFEFIDQVLAVVALCPQHTFIICTKRAARMAEYFTVKQHHWADNIGDSKRDREWFINESAIAMTQGNCGLFEWPLPNLWLMTTSENQARLEERVPYLLSCPDIMRGLSIEPLLGPVDLVPWIFIPDPQGAPSDLIPRNRHTYNPSIDWIIVGAESGPKRRPCPISWVERIVEQCASAGVACFVKQLDFGGRLSKNHLEWPEHLRVQQFPEVRQ